jgi:hypothetical protein
MESITLIDPDRQAAGVLLSRPFRSYCFFFCSAQLTLNFFVETGLGNRSLPSLDCHCLEPSPRNQASGGVHFGQMGSGDPGQ